MAFPHAPPTWQTPDQKAWFYYFTYPGKGKYADASAFHGIELKFLTGWLRPSRWGEPHAEDRKLVDLMTGIPGPGLPVAIYDPKSDLTLEIGHQIKLRPTPHTDRFVVFERSLNTRLASIQKSVKAQPLAR